MRRAIVAALLVVGCSESSGIDAGPTDAARVDAGPRGDGGGTEDAGAPIPGRGCPSDIASDPDVGQALPSIAFDTSYPSMTGTTIQVAAGGDLQAAIDSASPGDTIAIDPSGTYEGPFTLPEKTGDGWIVIRTSTPDAMLPPEGTRIDRSAAPLLPNLVVAGSVGPVFRTAARAHHYRLVGLELSPSEGDYANALIDLGPSGATSLAELAHDLVIDRCYLRADPVAGTRRGIALNSGLAAVIDSYFEGFFELGADSQAIAGWNGSGPFRIVNNHLEAASENILFGGSDPSITDLVPSDIEVCGNYFTKPIAWYGMSRNVKNIFELKNARRVLVAGNVMEHNWADGQSGAAIVFTPRNQDGTAPWSTIEDVTFVRNVVTRVGSGINILAEDDLHESGRQQRVVIQDNLIEVDNSMFNGAGRAFQIISPDQPAIDVLIAHNTVRVTGNSALTMGDSGPVAQGFVFRDNIAQHGAYGVFGGGVGEGTVALEQYVPGYVFRRNVLIGYTESQYPADNFFPGADGDVGFADTFGRLGPTSQFAGMASDGTDPGADFDALEAAIAGAMP